MWKFPLANAKLRPTGSVIDSIVANNPNGLRCGSCKCRYLFSLQAFTFQLSLLVNTSWCSFPLTRQQDIGRHKERLTTEYARCSHKLYKSTSSSCAQPQLPAHPRVFPGEERVCYHILYIHDPRKKEGRNRTNRLTDWR